ncbi:class I SAM-dependent DNA methyltransferase [Methylobacterium planeticum]|uniref:Methyltransferase domain-containing protein n=1 Tax=Methylobacterium planeticum TaxID=2615211 RepID=A0A6N6MKB1_9HYPH|nr:methyltransferase domain-containing protein [Methylobacterium planeticum]KAB1070080.1 methyltransferase domain-containing protein [Methylobacterium planeticum]
MTLPSVSGQRTSGDLRADRRYAYAEGCLGDGDAAGAAEMAEQALELAPRYAAAWLLLGRAREALHRASGGEADFHAALRAYSAALDLDPDDALGSRVRLVQLGGGEAAGALSPAYVRALFDGYAARFDRHLVEGLHYRGPEMLRDALEALPGAPARYAVALDLGCGTGLVGAAFAGRVGHLTGVDLSPAMLAQAERRRLYQRLVVGDLTGFLAGEPEASADLCVAADVFIYVGDLGAVLPAIARVLRPDGFVAFTVQSHDGAGIILGADARFAHGDAYLEAACRASGLRPALREPAAIRHERGRGVPGRLVVLSKAEP